MSKNDFRVTSFFKIIAVEESPSSLERVPDHFKIQEMCKICVCKKNVEFCGKTCKFIAKRCLFIFGFFYLNEEELK